MEISTRIQELIKKLDVKNIQFAKALNITPSYVTRLITGKGQPSPRLIEDICRKFHVNEEWLRDGTGEMFAEQDNSILAQLAERYALDGKAISLVESFLSLPAKHREIIVSAVENAARAMKNAAPAVTPEDMATYEKVKAQLAADPLSPEAPLSEEERELIQRMRLKKESSSRTAG